MPLPAERVRAVGAGSDSRRRALERGERQRAHRAGAVGRAVEHRRRGARPPCPSARRVHVELEPVGARRRARPRTPRACSRARRPRRRGGRTDAAAGRRGSACAYSARARLATATRSRARRRTSSAELLGDPAAHALERRAARRPGSSRSPGARERQRVDVLAVALDAVVEVRAGREPGRARRSRSPGRARPCAPSREAARDAREVPVGRRECRPRGRCARCGRARSPSPASCTVPSATARTGVPRGAAKSTPRCGRLTPQDRDGTG